MDFPTFDGLLRGFQQTVSTEHNLPDLTVSGGRVDAPIVVLVHGIGGNAAHWADPVSLNASSTWLFNLAADPDTHISGIGSSPPYAPGSVTSWCQLLANEGITYVTWSLTNPNDLLEFSVADAVAVLRGLEERVFAPYEADVAANGGSVPPLVILCHSRGGLVTRAALKQLGSAGVPHLRKVVTLCTPHGGSYMPRLAEDYNTTLSTSLSFDSLAQGLPGPLKRVVGGRITPLLGDMANRVRTALLHSFGTLAQGPGFVELDPTSGTMQSLVAGEQPFPNVQYHGFAGSDPTFIHFYLCELGHAFHLLATASPFLVEQIARIPGIAEQYGGLAELSHGDSAVGQESSKWPTAFGASHQVVSLNHMQALIDPALQRQVLDLIR